MEDSSGSVKRYRICFRAQDIQQLQNFHVFTQPSLQNIRACISMSVSLSFKRTRCKLMETDSQHLYYKWTTKTVMFLFASKVDSLQLLLTSHE